MSNYQDKKNIIAMLVDLSWQDGEMSESELEFINRIAEMYDIEAMDLLDIKDGKYKNDIKIPESESERIPLFQTCVMAMGLDHEIDERERNYCHQLGTKMGIRDEVIKKIMQLFEEYFPKPVPMDKLLAIYNMGRN